MRARTDTHARSVRASCSMRRTWRTGPPRPHRSAASLRTSLPHVPPAVGNVDWQREPPATTGTLRHCRCSRQHVKALTSSRRPRHARANQSATTTTGKAHLAVRVAHSARRLEHDEVGEARPAGGVHEEAAGGVYKQRPVLLQHAQDRRRPGAAIQPQHHGRALGHAALGRRVPIVVTSSSARSEGERGTHSTRASAQARAWMQRIMHRLRMTNVLLRRCSAARALGAKANEIICLTSNAGACRPPPLRR